MYSAISNLWYGRYAPYAYRGGHSQIDELISLMQRHNTSLLGELASTQKATYEKYCECAEEYTQLLSELAFHDGFCLASRLLAEAFVEN